MKKKILHQVTSTLIFWSAGETAFPGTALTGVCVCVCLVSRSKKEQHIWTGIKNSDLHNWIFIFPEFSALSFGGYKILTNGGMTFVDGHVYRIVSLVILWGISKTISLRSKYIASKLHVLIASCNHSIMSPHYWMLENLCRYPNDKLHCFHITLYCTETNVHRPKSKATKYQ